jgi:hypothetical protein
VHVPGVGEAVEEVVAGVAGVVGDGLVVESYGEAWDFGGVIAKALDAGRPNLVARVPVTARVGASASAGANIVAGCLFLRLVGVFS